MDGAATWRGRSAGADRLAALFARLFPRLFPRLFSRLFPRPVPQLLAIVCCIGAVVEFAVWFGSEHVPVGPPGGHATPTPVGSFGAVVAALTLMALASTLPVAFLGPVAAMVATSSADVLALTVFEALTAPAILIQVYSGYRLGRAGAQLVVVAAGVPFLLVALAGPDVPDVRVRAILLATLPPMAGLAGGALRSREETRIGSDHSEELSGALLRQAALKERTRIARDMHDVVAHHMSTISVQAETARLATPGMPPEGADRLLAIGEAARTALSEMRGLLGVLRGEDPVPDAGNRHPQPGLAELNDLIDTAREASGVPVRLILAGAPKHLDPGIELTAYRIVQEALSNARRHAPGAAIDVELHYLPDVLVVRVRDNGLGSAGSTAAPRASSTGSGYGLRGMHERAASVGGRVSAGPGPVAGFVVEAVLPNTVREAS